MTALTLRVIGTIGDGPVLGTTPFQYEVIGLPPGREALIWQSRNTRWQIRRASGGAWGEWGGDFESAEAALRSLQSEQP